MAQQERRLRLCMKLGFLQHLTRKATKLCTELQYSKHPFLYQPVTGSSRLSHHLAKQEGECQTTLSQQVSRTGVGLHLGEKASLSLFPAAAREGRYFVRRCLTSGQELRLPAHISYVVDTTLSTCIGLGQIRVHTVEHLLSALEGVGVDNCRIEINGGTEVPLLDGSARRWVEAVHEAGLSRAFDEEGNKVVRQVSVLKAPLFVSSGDSFIAAFPSSELRVTYGIDFRQAPAIGTQWFSTCLGDAAVYEAEIAPARTFGIYEEFDMLRAAGFIKGGTIDNALICSLKDGWMNPPLRFSNEPCRHKLLDLIGDLALCGSNGNPGLPLGHIVAFKASHKLHKKFGDALLCASEVK